MNDFLPPSSSPLSETITKSQKSLTELREWVNKPEGPLKTNLIAIYASGAALSLYCLVSILTTFGTITSFQEASDAYATTRQYSRAQDFIKSYGNFSSVSRLLVIFSLPFITAVIAWTFKAHKTVQPLSIHKRKWGLGWTIGSWFTPVGFFFIPLLVNRETEEIVSSEKVQKSLSGPAWFFSIWGAIVLRRIGNQWILDNFTQNMYVYILGDVLTIAAVVSAVLYFGEISLSVCEREPEISAAMAKVTSHGDLSVRGQSKFVMPRSDGGTVEADSSMVEEQIRMLGKLHADGFISDSEFSTKKADLLKRI